jgi:hypothetical protein
MAKDISTGVTMFGLPLLPFLLLLPLPLVIPSVAKGQSLTEWYDSLHKLPDLPHSPKSLDRLRYECHKLYFQYLVTGPAYVLDPAERIFFDMFILTLFGAIACCLLLLLPVLLNIISGGLLSGSGRVVMSERADASAMQKTLANMSLSIRTVAGTASVAQRNVTDGPGV